MNFDGFSPSHTVLLATPGKTLEGEFVHRGGGGAQRSDYGLFSDTDVSSGSGFMLVSGFADFDGELFGH